MIFLIFFFFFSVFGFVTGVCWVFFGFFFSGMGVFGDVFFYFFFFFFLVGFLDRCWPTYHVALHANYILTRYARVALQILWAPV